MAKVKVLPHPKVILVKQFIKDFNRDIAAVQGQIEVLNATLLYSAKVKNNALAAEAWPAARRASKVHKGSLAQLERLQCVRQTLETVRDQYGAKCRKLRSLQTRLQYANDQLTRAEAGVYDGIHARAQAIESSKSHIRYFERELNAFKI
jgi:hypothetical protein